ncbi:MAG: DUF4232 domain-containing protein [Acidimicrobiales bacterium]
MVPIRRLLAVVTVALSLAAAGCGRTSGTTAVPLACRTAQLGVTAGRGGVAAGHSGFPLLFRNTGGRACLLSGYPGIALLGSDGGAAIEAQPVPNGYIGGLRDYSGGPLPEIRLLPGETASALVEGDDAPPVGVAPCGPFAAIRVTPPHAGPSVRLAVRVPCSDVEVHPVVPGTTGQGQPDGR